MMRETVGGIATTTSEGELWHSLTLHKASMLLNIHRISVLLALGLCLYLIKSLYSSNSFLWIRLRIDWAKLSCQNRNNASPLGKVCISFRQRYCMTDAQLWPQGLALMHVLLVYLNKSSNVCQMHEISSTSVSSCSLWSEAMSPDSSDALSNNESVGVTTYSDCLVNTQQMLVWNSRGQCFLSLSGEGCLIQWRCV